MKKNKNLKRLLIVLIFLFILVAGGIVLFLTLQDSKSTLTVLEKRWVEKNKSTVIDIAIANDIPLFSNAGEGILFEFLTSFEQETGLEFNKIPYEGNDDIPKADYVIKLIENKDIKTNDLTIYSSDYVVVGKNKAKIMTIDEFSNTSIGVFEKDLDDVSYYLSDAYDVGYSTFSEYEKLYEALDNGTVNYIVLSYTEYINEIIKNKENTIVFHLNEMEQDYIISLNGKKELNNIIEKYYKKWSGERLEETYNEAFVNTYFVERLISENDKATFMGKRFVYGYLDYEPYETVVNDKLVGINSQFIEAFSNVSGIEFVYRSKIKEEEENLDIYFNYQDSSLKENFKSSVSVYPLSYVVLSKNQDIHTINSIKSLKNKSILIMENSIVNKFLNTNNIEKPTSHTSFSKLLSSTKTADYVVIDEDIYQYSDNKDLDDYSLLYQGNTNMNYSFVINTKDKVNNIFLDLFNFYISTIDINNSKSIGYHNLMVETKSTNFTSQSTKTLIIVILVVLVLILLMLKLLKKGNNIRQVKKEEKIRFVDMLTSLKNRNYLNYHMEEWNKNKVYPQSIVVVDLNNLKYINDNFGHEEGDNVIGMAANILINNQLENTDIIRTDGNEYLIYLVGYNEKQIIAYMRKLYKQLKELPHEFGAALGFSMIEDDIKTIEDAINEATLDMRKNKEITKE